MGPKQGEGRGATCGPSSGVARHRCLKEQRWSKLPLIAATPPAFIGVENAISDWCASRKSLQPGTTKMSMHEFEDLVEDSIRLLARNASHPRHDLRTLYWNLYEFHDLWDTGFTKQRVLDLLLAAHHTYRFHLSEHPDYQRFLDFFQHISAFSFIHVDPAQEWDAEHNPVAGYYQPPYLYCDVNSPLWSRFVRQGVLNGEDAVAVERQNPIDVTGTVVEDALSQHNFDLIARWRTLLGAYLFVNFDEEENRKHMALPSLAHVKRRFYQNRSPYRRVA
jgi:hypothetical protein